MASTILNANSVNAGGSGGNNGATGSYLWTTSTYSTGSITIPSSYMVAGNNGTSWTTITASNQQATLHVTGDAEIEGTLKVGGKDIAKSLEAIERRLAILVPDPAKLEHFEALQKAYNHYKMLEALCDLPTDKKE